MRPCASWAVAVVYLLQRDNRMEPVENITDYIRETNLTALGEKGATPLKTIRSMLGTKELDGHNVFYSETDDCYSLYFDSTKEHEEVQYVYQCLKNKRK